MGDATLREHQTVELARALLSSPQTHSNHCTMEHNKHEGDQPEKGLSSADYKARLLTKLNCLIAVLEVAIAKITRSREVPGANEERLLRIENNLKNTLSICHRAKQTLEGTAVQLPKPPATETAEAKPGTRRNMSYRDYVELSSIDEYNKFKKLPPITASDITGTDFDDLLGRLFQG